MGTSCGNYFVDSDLLIGLLTICIRETLKWVVWQTVKTQIKCSIIMVHFIRVFRILANRVDPRPLRGSDKNN